LEKQKIKRTKYLHNSLTLTIKQDNFGSIFIPNVMAILKRRMKLTVLLCLVGYIKITNN